MFLKGFSLFSTMLYMEGSIMKIIQTEKQLEFNHWPTKLEILREINKRGGLIKHDKLRREYHNFEKGFEGEKRLVQFLNDYGNPNWKALRNVWFENYTEFESDLILFTHPKVYTFEVKNYSGTWQLKNGQCFRNGTNMGHNPFSQAQKATTDLKGLLDDKMSQKLHGVLSFVGMHNKVQIYDAIDGIEVRMLNDLQDYIFDILEEEKKHLGYGINVDTILETLAPFEIGKPSKEREIPEDAKKNLRTGICCSHCGKYNLKWKEGYLVCSCGMHEPREEAIVRTICEYGVIHTDKELTTRELTNFFGKDIKRSTVYRYLKKHFERVGAKRGTYYVNKRLPFEKVRHEFNLTKPSYMRIDRN